MKRIVVTISKNCNLRCEYCSNHGLHWSIIPIEAAVRFIRGEMVKNPDGVDVLFFGGEPLLYPSTLLGVVSAITVTSKSSNIPIRFSVMTNGFDVSDAAKKLIKAYRFGLIEVSIDGTPDVHNHHRKTVDGQGTYADVSRFILWCIQSGLRVQANVTVSNDTVGRLQGSLVHLAHLGVNKIRVKPISSPSEFIPDAKVYLAQLCAAIRRFRTAYPNVELLLPYGSDDSNAHIEFSYRAGGAESPLPGTDRVPRLTDVQRRLSRCLKRSISQD